MQRERAHADVPGDMAPALGLRQAEVAKRARDAVGRMLAKQQIGRGPVRIENVIGRRLVDGEQRQGRVVPPSVFRAGNSVV